MASGGTSSNLFRTIVRILITVPTSSIILYSDQQMHNYFTNYHAATCFDTIVSSSDNLQSIPCQVTPVFQMQLSVIQFIILYYDQQMHNYLTNYHTATCFDTIVSSSDNLQSIPCQVTPVFQMQLSVIQFTIKVFHIGVMQVLIL
jgi:hypothetical protein